MTTRPTDDFEAREDDLVSSWLAPLDDDAPPPPSDVVERAAAAGRSTFSDSSNGSAVEPSSKTPTPTTPQGMKKMIVRAAIALSAVACVYALFFHLLKVSDCSLNPVTFRLFLENFQRLRFHPRRCALLI